ncbi:NADH:ubiquinone oxidoreductase complex I intermediate-associated protein 30 [Cyanobacterium stanieri PCC 7202]|uniref:NADH:ubiquinone oxidoreductase complex I intermediate-associated protein 30 n=1 Tax=Cyanobacterium stanieri (strain ATCC 29140 / PCC 7202) TaxID=292563 RepID=K9YLT2_CYASC|nr:NADH:ubiquinone oxidoreductase complex I intermediate-associated protein 30 [Cyanobacterium stanieri PCC 7202]
MEIKRLWETINYFEIFPWLNCLQNIFSFSQNNHFKPNITMNLILINPSQSELSSHTLNYLNQQKTNLKIINNTEQIEASTLERITNIICFPDNDNKRLFELINNTLKPEETLLFDFHNPTQEIKNLWGTVDDIVMGGVSQSSLKIGNQKVIFSGMVSTANNGGFASVRTKNFPQPWDLSNYQGIRLKVRGDGKRYKFITRCEGKWDGLSYCHSFDTDGNDNVIDIKFTDLIPVFRAKTVPEADKFDSSQMYSMQLMLSKFEYDGDYNPTFEAGSFALEIESITAYGAENVPQIILMGNPSQWQDISLNGSFLRTYAEVPEDLNFGIA